MVLSLIWFHNKVLTSESAYYPEMNECERAFFVYIVSTSQQKELIKM